jgi:hypothetical protein
MSNLKKEHKDILNLLEEYLSKEGHHHLRFTQALFILGVSEFAGEPDNGVFRDNFNDSDEKIIKKIKKNL